jgi:hypothetical protein
MAFQWLLQQVKCLPIISEWPVNDIDDFRVRTGRSRSQGTRTDAYTQLFLKQVQSAVRKAGGNPSRIAVRPEREAAGSTREAGARRLWHPSPRITPDGSAIPPGGSAPGGSSSRRAS